jgi:hypothetical protein
MKTVLEFPYSRDQNLRVVTRHWSALKEVSGKRRDIGGMRRTGGRWRDAACRRMPV